LESTAGKKNVYTVEKQMAKSMQYAVGVNCVKYGNGKVLVENDEVKEEWRKYTLKLLNEENTRDNTTTCENVEGLCELIRRDEILKALRMMKKGKAVQELCRKCLWLTKIAVWTMEWLTSLCNLIVAQGRIPHDWRSSILLPVFKGKGDPIECTE